ncbi:hypothetical protein RRG08_059451 [Elysia crispata]|uniref:Uncharacterized protein n=1 Tax=Elysia crispata TaxID=231223 RepID=A0AAE1A5U1_9GAST|nr:hypothetical protein RRG08_059451 [Elysia crispata]
MGSVRNTGGIVQDKHDRMLQILRFSMPMDNAELPTALLNISLEDIIMIQTCEHPVGYCSEPSEFYPLEKVDETRSSKSQNAAKRCTEGYMVGSSKSALQLRAGSLTENHQNFHQRAPINRKPLGATLAARGALKLSHSGVKFAPSPGNQQLKQPFQHESVKVALM